MELLKNNFFNSKLPGLIIILIFLITGLFTFDDYGISWDEKAQREIGYQSYNYMFKGDKSLYDFKDRDYGVAFELPLVILENIFNHTDLRDIYNMRHLCIHLLFILGLWCFYLNSRLLYKDNFISIIVLLLVALHPRLYAHSFFNSKDLVFLSMFMIVFYLVNKAFLKPTVWRFLFLGIACGLLVNIRIMGVLPVLMILLFILIDFISNIKIPAARKLNILFFIVFILFFIGALLGSWPYLWIKPAKNFITAFNNMSVFRLDIPILYLGEKTGSANLPWHYFSVWFGLTTPVLYLLSSIKGIIIILIDVAKNPLRFIKNNIERNYIIYLGCFFGPVIAVIVFNSVLYDGWRQMFFVYPGFALLAGYGLKKLIANSEKVKKYLFGVFSIYFAYIIVWMLLNHPYQNVYFNEILPRKSGFIREYMELDYWGVTYKQALEFVARTDKKESIKLWMEQFPGEETIKTLADTDRSRLIHTLNMEEADYFISNYRWHPQEYEFENAEAVFEIRSMNSEIIKVWKFKRR